MILKRRKLLLVYFMISIFFMEAIVRLATVGSFFSYGHLISLFFTMSLAILLFIICSFFNGKISYTLSTVLLGVTSFIFSSQLVYYNTFYTFYSMYSAGYATQVLQFWRDIGALIFQNLFWIILVFLPTLLLIAFGKKLLSFEYINNHWRFALVCSVMIVHLFGAIFVYAGGKEQNSAYDLYFNSSNVRISVDRLGLITTMRLDLQRLILGWSPVLEISTPFFPEPAQVNWVDGRKNHDLENKQYYNNVEEKIEDEVIEYNTMNIDFDDLISNEDNDVLMDMHNYFKSVPPTPKNEFTGKYEGYNLVFITAEAFSLYAVNEDVTPTLYKLVNEGYHFTDFYTPLWEVSTSDGEYVALQGLIPTSGVWSFQESGNNHLPFVMGNQLKQLGYTTKAYHNHSYTYYGRDVSHPNMGYEYKGIGNGLNVREIWPASDLEMMEVTVPEYIHQEPFHTYYLTISGHLQYNFGGNNMALKNKEYVDHLPYSNQGKAYMATQIELDRALEHLLNELEEAGVSDSTLIAISTDHYPYGLDHEVVDELTGHHVEENFELHKSPFILYTKDMDPLTINEPSSSLDIIPTLSNILGLEYDSRLLMGRDLFAATDPLVIFSNKSFITDKGRYNSLTKEFTTTPGNEVDADYINWIRAIIDSKFYYSALILETDYYGEVLKD